MRLSLGKPQVSQHFYPISNLVSFCESRNFPFLSKLGIFHMSESLKVEKLGIIFVSDGSLIKLCSLSCSSLEVNPQIKNYPKNFLKLFN